MSLAAWFFMSRGTVNAQAMSECTSSMVSCSYADAKNVIAKGKPFFPFGMYFTLNHDQMRLPYTRQAAIIKDALTDMKNNNVNLAVLYYCYPKYCDDIMEHARQINIKVMLYDDEIDGYRRFAQRYKNNPAFFGYFSSDDANAGISPGCYGPDSPSIANGSRIRKAVLKIDTRHVFYISPGAKFKVSDMEKTLPNGKVNKIDCADVTGTQMYPIYANTGYTEPLNFVYKGGVVSRTVANRYNQAYLHNLQTSNHHRWTDPTAVPTPVEVRNMAYQAIIAQAQGFVSYIYNREADRFYLPDHPDLWLGIGKLGSELESLSDVLTSDTLSHRVIHDSNDVLAAVLKTRESSERKILLVVNMANKARSATITGADITNQKMMLLFDGLTAKSGSTYKAGDNITLSLAAQDTLVFEIGIDPAP